MAASASDSGDEIAGFSDLSISPGTGTSGRKNPKAAVARPNEVSDEAVPDTSGTEDSDPAVARGSEDSDASVEELRDRINTLEQNEGGTRSTIRDLTNDVKHLKREIAQKNETTFARQRAEDDIRETLRRLSHDMVHLIREDALNAEEIKRITKDIKLLAAKLKKDYERGSFQCGSNCALCPAIKTIRIADHESEMNNEKFTCNSSNVVYIITCGVCNAAYVGKTTNPLKVRMAEHRKTVKKNVGVVGQHFSQSYHQMKVSVIQRPVEVAKLLDLEETWMKRIIDGKQFFCINDRIPKRRKSV